MESNTGVRAQSTSTEPSRSIYAMAGMRRTSMISVKEKSVEEFKVVERSFVVRGEWLMGKSRDWRLGEA